MKTPPEIQEHEGESDGTAIHERSTIEDLLQEQLDSKINLPSILLLLINVLLVAVFVTELSSVMVKTVQALLVCIIWGAFIFIGRRFPEIRTYGWNWIVIGLNLLVFGLLISISDHIFFLKGATDLKQNEQLRLFLENLVGTVLGFSFIIYGLYKWVPSFLESKLVVVSYLRRLRDTVKLQREELVRAEARAAQAEEIRQLKEFNENIVHTIPSPLLVLDRKLKVLSGNRLFLENFGADSDVLVGERLATLVDSALLEEFVVKNRALRDVRSGEVLIKLGARERIFEVTLSGEQEDLLLLVFVDITERKRAQETERQLQVQLLQAEKLSALGELVSGVAHELNNPLSIISGYAELIAEEEEIPEETRDLLGEIGKGSFRCKRIVENLLTFARQHKPHRDLIDLNQVLKDALALRTHQLRIDNIAVQEDYGELPETVADGHQIHQVLFNLINNAYQALKEDPKPDHFIKVSTQCENGIIQIEITDNGPGIPESARNKIFDPFFTTKKVGEGTGLGLSISYGIIREHGGTIQVESQQGQGTTFKIDLPLCYEATDVVSSVPDRDLHMERLMGKCILVIDDEEKIANVCRMGLERYGCQVETTDDGQIALGLLKETPYDLVLSDIRMPGMDGPEIYAAVKDKDPDLARRMIFMTGDTVGDETKEFLEVVGNPVLNKPFSLDELRAVVGKMVRA